MEEMLDERRLSVLIRQHGIGKPKDDAVPAKLLAAFLPKSPSVKQWTAPILFLGICSSMLTFAMENYREYRSFERSFDLLASECAQHGGCTLPGYDF